MKNKSLLFLNGVILVSCGLLVLTLISLFYSQVRIEFSTPWNVFLQIGLNSHIYYASILTIIAGLACICLGLFFEKKEKQ